jgi:ferrochelatase
VLTVRYAMRYGNPSIASELDQLKAEGATRILIVPLYPQYSGTTTASVFDAVYTWAAQVRHLPELRFVNRYHDDPAYIDALARRGARPLDEKRPARQLVMSFHGVPERTLHLGDPYHCECLKTARLLAERLGLRQGPLPRHLPVALWQGQVAAALHRAHAGGAGTGRHEAVQVVCPGFTSDCLETLEEIAMEAREAFLHAGGQEFHYIPA